MKKRCDLLVIGAGAGGCAAAMTSAHFRQNVILVEQDKLGGTSLHRGCTPLKSLLVSARYLHRIHHAQDYGVNAVDTHGSLVDFLTRQRSVVSKEYEDLQNHIQKLNIPVLKGSARLTSPTSAEILHEGKVEEVEFNKLILATGSRPVVPAEIPTDGHVFMNSDHVLNMTDLPKSMILIGGGNIAAEYATIFSTLGCQVTIVEQANELLPQLDHAAGKFLKNALLASGVQVSLNSKAIKGWKSAHKAHIALSDGRELEADRVLVALGRRTNIETLWLEKAEVKFSDHIEVDSRLQTSQKGIYAVGDCNGLFAMAHASIVQGRMAALNALGEDHRFDTKKLPVCIYTTPEIGAVGWTESEAMSAGYDIVVAQHPFSAVGRAVAMGELSGFVKLIADRSSEKLLGAVITGGQATEMIGQLTLALTLSATVTDLTRVVAVHPTLSEAIQEAAWGLFRKLR